MKKFFLEGDSPTLSYKVNYNISIATLTHIRHSEEIQDQEQSLADIL